MTHDPQSPKPRRPANLAQQFAHALGVPPGAAPAAAGVSIVINLAAGAVLNISLAAGADAPEA